VPPSVKLGRMIAGSSSRRRSARVRDRARIARLRQLEPDLLHRLAEAVAVLGLADRVELRADQPHAVALEHARLAERDREVQRGLAAERGQDHVGALARDDQLERLDRHRLDVGALGELGIGHDRGRVRVHEDDAVALFAQRLAALRARVVELARLADHDRPGADHEDRADVLPLRHSAPRLPAAICAPVTFSPRRGGRPSRGSAEKK
jgi:hypothetical protein